MKLIRFGEPGNEKPGAILNDGALVDASGFGRDYDEAFFAGDGLTALGGDGLTALATWLAANGASAPRVEPGTRLGSCVCRPSKIVCIGLNYRDHAIESGMELPKEPVIFFKSTTALCGPNDDLVIPRNSVKTDWEVELAVVIGRKASYVSEDHALEHVAGYALHNDYSERAFQLEHGGQWVKGKSCDTFAPLGPYLATPDEIGDPGNLDMWLNVNGEKRQKSTTANLVFGIATLVSYLSQFMTLLPGDVISTGTPGGVGLGMKPPQFLKPGDVITLGIAGLGEQRQVAKACA
jgi:2,4-didehydro-3-deoxy-L-rhamnonate hydrolase